MAKIIIQGPKEEVKKAKNVLKQTFDVTSEIVNTRTDEERIAILDVYSMAFGKDKWSDEEIDKALWCCCKKERDCVSCPFVKEENCREKMQIEVALWLQRIDRARQEKERREKEGANDN